MDALIRRFTSVTDGDLKFCHERGVAYQADMTNLIAYDDDYFDRYVALKGQPIARALNAGRVDLVNRHAGVDCQVVDVGIGSGEFIASRPNTVGTDVNPKAVKWLQDVGLRAGALTDYTAFTFWDVLEHVVEPHQSYFRHIPDGAYLFTSIPVFPDLSKVRLSRHYKPNEHLYYFTPQGFIDWMALYRFRLLEQSDLEVKAGRDSIGSFAFKRDLPGYHDTLAQYQAMHAAYYGASAYLYFETIAREVMSLNPGSILDYGCGRSDLVAHFWKDGARRVAKFDPAIPQFKDMPDGEFGLVLCTDVMEHIRMEDVDRVLGEIRRKSSRALFTISMKPARAKLPDGRNAHVTLLSADEWTAWIGQVFGRVRRIPTQWDHILMLRTW